QPLNFASLRLAKLLTNQRFVRSLSRSHGSSPWSSRCQQYPVPELIVPVVHRVAVHTTISAHAVAVMSAQKHRIICLCFCALNLLYFIDFQLPVSGDASQEPSKKSWLENSKRDSCLNCPKIWGQFRPVEGVSS
ncbi:MAG: hypothetical protein MSL09_03755, partial [Spirochaetia bacterium]|nr:hypothetical protein [Spirochaetia bacterium]